MQRVTGMGLTVRLLVGAVMVDLVIAAFAARLVLEDKKEHERRAQVTVENISLVLYREIGAVLSRVDLTLLNVRDQVESDVAAGRVDDAWMAALLARQKERLPEIISLRITDEEGRVRYGEGVVPGMVSLGDRDFFLRQRDDPHAGAMVVGRPVAARISQEWVVPVSRRLDKPGGRFGGVVYANIPVSYFVSQFASLNLGDKGVVALRSSDHVSMARFPVVKEGGGVIGQVAASDRLRALLKSNSSGGTYFATSPADQIERIYSYRKISEYSLYLVVGVAKDDYLDEWAWSCWQKLGGAALLCLVIGVLAWLVARFSRRQQDMLQAHREDAQRLSLAMEGGELAIWDIDLSHQRVQLSELGWQLLGYPRDERGASLRQWGRLCHPDDRQAVASELKDLLRGRGKKCHFQCRLACRGGGWKRFDVHGTVVSQNAAGRGLRMTGVMADITAQFDREEAYQSILRTALDGFWLVDQEGRILEVNDAYCSMSGYSRRELLAMRIADLEAWERPEETAGHIRRIIERNRYERFITGHRKKDGSLLEVEISTRFMPIRGGVFIAFIRDITELRHATAHLDAIFDQAPLGMAILDVKDDSIIKGNRTLARILGYSPEEMIGRKLHEMTHPEDAARAMELSRQVKNGEIPSYQIEKRFVAKDGGVIWCQLTATVVRDSTGVPLYGIRMVDDITDRKRLNERSSPQMLMQRDILIREVHHRIKNNLQSVAGLLRRELGKHPQLHHALEKSISQVNSMALVHGLQGLVTGEQVPLDTLVETIARAIEDLTEHRIELFVSRRKKSPSYVSSEEAVPIALILNELVFNAVKHTWPADELGRPVMVEVSCNGPSALVRIVNHTSTPPSVIALSGGGKNGSGLRLINALLPEHGASLDFSVIGGNEVWVELYLREPVVYCEHEYEHGPSDTSTNPAGR